LTEAVPVRPASTVLLVRDGDMGIEVFMVVRHRQIEFASGALVFPGGSLDPEDRLIAADPLLCAADGLDAISARLRTDAGAVRHRLSGCTLRAHYGTN